MPLVSGNEGAPPRSGDARSTGATQKQQVLPGRHETLDGFKVSAIPRLVACELLVQMLRLTIDLGIIS